MTIFADVLEIPENQKLAWRNQSSWRVPFCCIRVLEEK